MFRPLIGLQPLPTVTSANSEFLCSIAQDHFLTQLINSPTRGDHILDLVFTNRPDYLTAVRPMDNLPGTDHDSVELNICIYPPQRLNHDKRLYNYKKADFCALKELMSHIPWDQLDFESDIEDACIPMQTTISTRKKILPFYPLD